VVIETGTYRYPCEVMDISNRGAKVITRDQLETGSVVRLQIVAPDGTPLRVGAVVRRIDADGLAFSFTRSIYHRFIHVA
jgi:FtsZ-interacting cell division protein ZipA